MKERGGEVCLVYLTAYQHIMGYLMPNFFLIFSVIV